MSIKSALMIAVAVALGHQLGLETGDTDGEVTLLTFLFAFAVGPFVVVTLIARRRWQQPKSSLSQYARSFALILIAGAISWTLGWWRVHPSNIRYSFANGSGASGTWREVQFKHLEAGVWLEGPWVGAWPMAVRFPDVNADGNADIQVTGQGTVTFIYLPNNDGRKYWHLIERDGKYQVSYPAAGLISP